MSIKPYCIVSEYLNSCVFPEPGFQAYTDPLEEASPGPTESASSVSETQSETALVVHGVVQENLLLPTNPRTLSKLQDAFDKGTIRGRFREVDILCENGQADDVFGSERFIDKARRLWEQSFPADPFHEERFKRHYVTLGIKWLHLRHGVKYGCYDETNGDPIDRSPTPGDARRLCFLTLSEQPSHCLKVLEGISRAAEADLGHVLQDKEALRGTIESDLEKAYDQLVFDKVDYYFEIMTRSLKHPIELSTEEQCLSELTVRFELPYPLLPIQSDVDLVYAIALRLEQNHSYEHARLALPAFVEYIQGKVDDFNHNPSLVSLVPAAATCVTFQSLS
jgi:hypothetical protein